MDRSDLNNQCRDIEQGKEEPKAPSADSGLSAEDFSLISSGTSDFSLLEISSGKDKESEDTAKDKQGSSALRTEGTNQNNLEHGGASFVEKTGTNDKNFQESKFSAASSTADISILGMPEDDELDVNDIEEDSCPRNNFNLINLPVGKKSDLEAEQFISHSRPKDHNNHESSELGSSFSIIDDFNISSSYPPSFDDVIDKSKIKVLPPKSSVDAELSTSVDENGQKITKKKSIHGGIVEIVVHREDWKQDETEKLISLTDETDGTENLKPGEDNKKTELGKLDDTEVVTEVDSAVQQSTGDVDTDMETNRQKDTPVVNIDDTSASAIEDTCKYKQSNSDKVKEEGKYDETIEENRTDNNLAERRENLKQDITDPIVNLVFTGNQNEAGELLDDKGKYFKNDENKNGTEKEDVVESPQDPSSPNDQRLPENHTETDQKALDAHEDSHESPNHSAKQDEKSLEFSLISSTEVTEYKMSKYFGKSDVDSDRLSTNSESSSNGSTSSVEIHMEEPIVESSEDNEIASSDRSRTSTKEEEDINVGVDKESFIHINKEGIDHDSLGATPESQIGVSTNDKSEERLPGYDKGQVMDTEKDLTDKNTDNLSSEKETGVNIPTESDHNMATGGEQRKSFVEKSYDDCSFKLRPITSLVSEQSEQNLQREITSENKNYMGSENDVKYVSLPSTESKTETNKKMLENGTYDGDDNEDSPGNQEQDKKVTGGEGFIVINTENTNRDLRSETTEEGDGAKDKLSEDFNEEQVGSEKKIPGSHENELGFTSAHIEEFSVGKDPGTRVDFGKTDDENVDDYSIINAPESDTDRKDSSSSVCSDFIQQTGMENVKDVITNEDGMKDGRSPSVSDVSTSGSESPDIWQPSEGFRMITKDEEKVSQSFSKKYEMGVTLRYFNSSDKNRSHQSEVKKMTIQMESELEFAKWTYVLTRKDKLLKDRCSNTSITFNVSYAELDLVRYDTTDDPLKIEQWYSEVIEKVKQEVGKISSCVICCLQESSERVFLMAEKIRSAQNIDLDFEHKRMGISLGSNESTREDAIIVTGQSHDVAMVMLEMDAELVKVYQLQGSHLVSLTPCKFPINNVQHDIFIKFEGHMSLDREFPGILSVVMQDSLKLLVQRPYVERVPSVLFKKWLKFKHVSKVMLKPSEFSLLCKTSVKDFFVKCKLDPLGYDYRWTLQPAKGEIIVYTESREEADEIKDTIFSSFKEYVIKLNDVQMDYIRNTDKWTEICADVQNQSKGMAEIGLHDDQRVVIVIGTDDIMTAWEKYGTLTSISKDIKDLVKVTEKITQSKTELEKQVKKFVQIDGDKLDIILRHKTLEITEKCDDKNVQVVNTDIGFEVIGVDESKVKEICDYLLQLSHETVKKQIKDIKRFVKMTECDVDMVFEQKSDILESYSEKLEVDFDGTNLGFEVRGKTEKNVKEFCDILIEMKEQVARQHQQTTDQFARQQNKGECNDKQNVEKAFEMYDDSFPVSKVVRFFQLDDGMISFIEKYKMVELQEIMVNIEVNLSKTTFGFEVRGSAEIDVQTILDRLMNLKSQIETRRIENVSRLTENNFQKLEQKYKCIVKHLADGDNASKLLDDSDVEDAAVWHINGVKVSVAVKGAEVLVCDVIVQPMDEKLKEIRKNLHTCATKKFQYQEKQRSEEVEIPAPLYAQDAGKQKHELTALFSEMLTELSRKDYGVVALPVNNFNGWPPMKLTKVMMSSLIEFCRSAKQHSIQKMRFFSSDAAVCQKVIQTIQDALSGLKGDNLAIGLIKKPAKFVPETQKQPEPKVEKDDSKHEKSPNPSEKDYPRPKTPPPMVHLKPEIVVIKGVIAQQDVHAIVNTTSQDFDLRNGAVSKSILDTAGKDIQKEVKRGATYTKPGEIVVTGGYNLKCKAVFHGALLGFDRKADHFNQKGVKVLEKFIMNCLQKAHIRNYKSIAFPVLGAGALEFPHDVVATVMIETVEKFRKKISETKLSEVRVVVYRDEGIYFVFKKMVDSYRQEFLREIAGPTLPVTPKADGPIEKVDTEDLSKDDKLPVSPDLPTQGINLDLGPTSLSAALGDVTKLTEFDCLILLWPQDEINAPSSDKETILKSVGRSSLTQWETGKDLLSDSKVLVTPGGALPQKTIIHVYVDDHDLQKAFELGLNKADELKILSAVIPVRPTDQLAKDVVKFSSCIYKAVTEKCNQLNSMRHVRLCIGGKHLCQPILATLAKLHETTGAVNANTVQSGNSVTVEITALKDDMDTIIAEIKPETLNEKQEEIEEINEVKDKTLTKEDIEVFSRQQTQFLVNVRAEIDPDIVEAVRQRNQLDVMKNVVEKSSEHVKLVEQGEKWLVHGSSFTHIETCLKNIQEFWEKFMNGQLDKHSGKEKLTDTKIVIKVDITKDLFKALMFLERKKVSEVIGDAKIRFLESSGSLEIECKDFGNDKEQNIKRVVSRFQTNMVMDVVEVPYQRLKEMKRENFVIKLQTEYPDVYIYAESGNEAEASFNVYIVSLSRDNLKSAKQGIQTEYLKTSTRTGRFTQSQLRDKKSAFQGRESFTRSYSHQERTPKPKHYQTAEGLSISIYMADIRSLPVDCIVNAANGHLLHGGGVAAIISDAAGKAFDKECQEFVKSYGQIKTGECCVTNAGNLPYKRVIHGVGPQWSPRKTTECCDLLQKTIEQCIQTANAHGMKSVAIPSISAGLYGMPAEICAKCYAVGVMTVSANRTGLWSLQEIHFVDNKPDMVFKVQAAFSDYFENSGTTRQRSVEELFQSVTNVDQFRQDKTIINKLINNDSLSKTEAFLKGTPVVVSEPRETTLTTNCTVPANVENVQQNQQPCKFLLNQNPIHHEGMSGDFKLPSSWQITIKRNLVEIQTCPNFKVFIFGRDFTKLVSESIAFGQDTDWEKRSSLVKSVSANKDLKDKLKQLKVQVPEPAVGTIASFDTVNGVHVQNVFVVFTPRYTEMVEKKKFCDDLMGCYLKLFQEASMKPDIDVLAVSFLKTGNKGIPFKEGAEVFLHAVSTFTARVKPDCTLKQINLILNKETNALDGVKLVVQHRYGNKDTLVFIDEKVDKHDIAMIGHKVQEVNREKEENPQNGKTEHEEKGDGKSAGSTDKVELENCAICLEVIQETDMKILEKCKHKFCKECIEECFKHRPVCPSCGTVYGVVIGDQPKGTMHVDHKPDKHLPGYTRHGQYVIMYSFKDGTQTAEHQNPGQRYRGTYRTAYLPDNEKGTLVMKLLKIAFERKLVFTIGHSRTTGEENVVTWNDVHHKTNTYGGQQGFGYPDPEYLDRVLDELAAKGVTEADLK